MAAQSIQTETSIQWLRRVPFAAFVVIITFLFTASVSSQGLPDRIRGYKVLEIKDPPAVGSSNEGSNERGASIELSAPDLVNAGLTGITFEIDAHLNAFGQSGRVDFLTFYDFRVNGVPITVEEFVYPFAFQKEQMIRLPEPLRIFLPSHRLAQAAWKEMSDSQESWKVTGRVFVFGKFRKFGMHFKRVVPVDISIDIKNPLRPDPS